MPSFRDWSLFSYITLGFVIQYGIIFYLTTLMSIKDNWLENRCNPMYMPFADDIQSNFIYCIQNVQSNLMPFLLEPIHFILSLLTNFGGGISDSVNSLREWMNSFVGNATNIFVNIYGAFMGLIIAFQRIVLGIQDMINKMVGVVITLLYILEGTMDSMSSAWAGPPGQLVRAMCFHPQTQLRKYDSTYYPICECNIGDVLYDGSFITRIHCFLDSSDEILYDVNESIKVTGEHFIYYNDRWIMVKDVPNIKQSSQNSDILYCLETSSQNIIIDNYVFWDWNDDNLKKKYL